MQRGSWGVRRGLLARVGVAEGILLVAEYVCLLAAGSLRIQANK